ncbi:hypothetical protein QTJ16_001437 [Diplocarpon rosae]|uniref:chitinase n=1 Tax=Diplocarpon rosae TaxID=946125 RepID=A0AAD9WG90_9HELO|nr:hypothetical protein QTJ16_001437 [Diplocarpon rosae]PBP22307.1 chitinase [Diplocarpon rosae]
MYCSAILSFLYLAGSALAGPVVSHRSGPARAHGRVARRGFAESEGMRAVGYYGNWDIYARKFFVTDIDDSQLTHLIYSFANVKNDTGEVYLSDEWADIQYAYPGDVASNSTEPQLLGNLKQLYLKKKKNRNLKVLLAILGYTYSPNMVPVLASAELRANFVSSAVKLVTDLGLDGLDVDYEYVSSATEAANMVILLQDLRAALDAIPTNTTASPFLLTCASPAGPDKYKILDLPGMDDSLSFWNLMGYDYSGSWDKIAAHSSNLLPDEKSNLSTPFSSEAPLKYYVDAGISPLSINLGMPLYGRAFANTRGLGQPFNNTGSTIGSYDEANVWDVKDLPIEGSNATVYNLKKIGASYSYDASKQYLVSYDTPKNAKVKAEYIEKHGYGGAMWWEISQDRQDSDSLIKTVVKSFGGEKRLEQSLNHLDYPTSKYENLRHGFPHE